MQDYRHVAFGEQDGVYVTKLVHRESGAVEYLHVFRASMVGEGRELLRRLSAFEKSREQYLIEAGPAGKQFFFHTKPLPDGETLKSWIRKQEEAVTPLRVGSRAIESLKQVPIDRSPFWPVSAGPAGGRQTGNAPVVPPGSGPAVPSDAAQHLSERAGDVDWGMAAGSASDGGPHAGNVQGDRPKSGTGAPSDPESRASELAAGNRDQAVYGPTGRARHSGSATPGGGPEQVRGVPAKQRIPMPAPRPPNHDPLSAGANRPESPSPPKADAARPPGRPTPLQFVRLHPVAKAPGTQTENAPKSAPGDFDAPIMPPESFRSVPSPVGRPDTRHAPSLALPASEPSALSTTAEPSPFPWRAVVAAASAVILALLAVVAWVELAG